jgi:hypothetical protein
MMAFIRLRILMQVTALFVLSSTWAAPASTPLEYARQVGYISAPVAGPYWWAFDCTADEPETAGAVAIASGTVYRDDWMSGFIHKFARWSEDGSVIRVGDDEMVFEPRKERTVTQTSTFGGGGSSSAGDGTAYVAWALWGSPASCTASVNGNNITPTYLPGQHAFYAGPGALTTGVSAENDGTHLSVARTFSTSLDGGPLFATLALGSTGQGFFRSDDPYRELVEDCRSPNGDACQYTRPAVHEFTAGLVAALETGGGYQGELVVIALPPE